MLEKIKCTRFVSNQVDDLSSIIIKRIFHIGIEGLKDS